MLLMGERYQNQNVNGNKADEPGGKKKFTKSRNGCLTCKKRRQKCDEMKPACLICQKKNLVCGGYATNFKWKLFKDSKDETHVSPEKLGLEEAKTTFVKLEDDLKKVAPVASGAPNTNKQNADFLQRHLELASLSVVGRPLEMIRIENDLISKGINPRIYHEGSSGVDMNVTIDGKHNAELLTLDSNIYSIESRERGQALKRSHSFSNEESPPVADSFEKSRKKPRAMSSGVIPKAHPWATLEESKEKIRSQGLDSLAEAALDELSAKTVSSPAKLDELQVKGSLASSLKKDFMSTKVNHNHELLSGSTLNKPKSLTRNNFAPDASARQNSLEGDDPNIEELNLTPSLSALLTFAFNSNENANHGKNINSKEYPLTSTEPMSPIWLNNPGDLLTADISVDHVSNKLNKSFSDNPDSTKGGSMSSDKLLGQQGTPFDHTGNNDNSLSSLVSPLCSVKVFPSLLEASEKEKLLFLYTEYTCAVMSIKNGFNDNPWKTVTVPFAYKYPCLFNSMASMALFHLSGNPALVDRSEDIRLKGYYYIKKCILALASGLSKMDTVSDLKQKLPADIALVTCLNLAVTEAWDTQTSSGIAHLRGAKSMIQKVFALLREYRAALENYDRKSIDLRAFSEARASIKGQIVMVSEHEWEVFELENNKLISEPVDDRTKGNSQNLAVIPESLQFLFNVWIYFEVMARMTSDSNHDYKGIDLVATITSVMEKSRAKTKFKARMLLETSSNYADSEREDMSTISNDTLDNGLQKNDFYDFAVDGFKFLSYNNDQIDPLLGCAQSLFVILGKVASLVSRIKLQRKDIDTTTPTKKWKTNTLTDISLATQLKQDLTAWKPRISSTMMNQNHSGAFYDDANRPSNWSISECIAMAEAYRYAALLYLHQAVPEIPSVSSHQLAEKIFILLASIPAKSQLHCVEIFPLLVGSCEAESLDEKQWCAGRWKLLKEVLWIGNLDRAFEVVKEVWVRKEKHSLSYNNSFEDMIFVNEKDEDDLKNVSVELRGLMAAVNGDHILQSDILGGINSRFHWSSVMKEWGWEVLLG